MIEKKPWHALPYETLFLELNTSKEGISDISAKNRIKQYGANVIEKKKGENFFKIFFKQFCSPLIYILLFSMSLSLVFGQYTDALVIFSVIILNTLIGGIQEYKSSRAIHALGETVQQMATVIRMGVHKRIPAFEITVGDILVLEPGERCAADVRLFSLKNLACDESILTGESLPVFKRVEMVSVDSSVAERKCIAYKGTLIVSGYALGIVFGVGVYTEIGKIASLLQEVISVKTPLAIALDRLAKSITYFVFFIALGVFVTAYLRGYGLIEGVLASIALAVAAIPEGLPAVITITAAIGVNRMAKKNTIIRHLEAVETLGSTTVICTDKTGTLTENKIRVVLPYVLSIDDKELIRACVLCNTASIEIKNGEAKFHGDPTENALLIYARKQGCDEQETRKINPRLDLLPFDVEKRWMASLHQDNQGKKILFIKGSPESICDKCVFSDLERKKEIDQQLFKMVSLGMRVLAVAKKEIQYFKATCSEADVEEGFCLLGLLGMIDPPRVGVDEAIKTCKKAGIKVKMITGDHPETARKIAQQVGLDNPEEVLTGEMIDAFSEAELSKKVMEVNVFARTLPHHKLKIVQLLQKEKEVVAMTGDGVNDSLSLKQADIGIAMGCSGTSVAKEASDMILVDDDFKTIELAIEEGRHVYDNLIKSLLFLFPTSLAQALIVVVAVFFFPIYEKKLLMPILPVQILWVNLIVAVALALPLAFEAIEPNLMQRRPRKSRAPLLSRSLLIRTVFVGSIMMIGTIGSFFLEYFFALDSGLSHASAQIYSQSSAVTTLVFFQIFYLFKCRSFDENLFKIGFFSNHYLLGGVGAVIIAQVVFLSSSIMQKLFHSCFLNINSWLISIGIGFLVIPCVFIEKWILRKMELSA